MAQLEHHARGLAGWHKLAPARGRAARLFQDDHLLSRLAENEQQFFRAYGLITDAVARGRRITPAADWFIDNYPLIDEQIRTARRHLPRGYSRTLPRLANTRVRGTPRVYDLALELISHSHGRVDDEGLRAFVTAYQSRVPLRLGELWAIPIMLRLALLENLRRIVASITAGRRERERAMHWNERLTTAAAARTEDVVIVLAELVRAEPVLTDPFVAELAARLQGNGPPLVTAWLEQHLAERGETLAHIFQRASQAQAADQVAIGNSIGSLRSLGATDWRVFVEDTSVVEATLRTDPAGVYASMDFATRDRYRHVVERLGRDARREDEDVDEDAVARAVVDLAAAGTGKAHHVGWYLVDAGLPLLERQRGVPVSLIGRLRGAAVASPLVPWLASIGGLTLALTLLLLGSFSALTPSTTPTTLAGLLALVLVQLGIAALLAIGTSQLAVALTQLLVTQTVPPSLLTRLDFQRGVPAGHETLVAVPALLVDADEVDALVADLELRFLANRDERIFFALVTDLRDAATAVVDGDDALVARAVAGIAALNVRHAAHGLPFFLLHRARRENRAEGVWMGRERKRGKLDDLNATLRGAVDRFVVVEGDLGRLQAVRYVIALDADTRLPRDSARLLVATLAHPLHRPVYDDVSGRVVGGYAILQPRVGVSMTSALQTRFAQLFADAPGIDPYTRAVSDAYQDFFGEGSFIGKGVYDVDAYAAAVDGRFPDNRVLSHDLLEGAHARCGFVSDVVLIEDHPPRLAVELVRRARWIRGDWQIAAWLRSPPTGAAGRPPATLSRLSRWKIFDNLRRSLVSPALLLLLCACWLEKSAAVLASVVVVVVVFLPGLLGALAAIGRRGGDASRRQRAPSVLRDLGRQLLRDLLTLAWLPADAALALRSIGLALWRVNISGRRLLEWRTASDASRAARHGIGGCYGALWAAPVAGVVVVVVLAVFEPRSLGAAAPFALLWLIGPLVAWFLGEPLPPRRTTLDDADQRFLRGVARRTWRFFERYVTAADNHLPPDNFQEEPFRGVAHRTSPTNIGLALTANLAARDFGYLTTGGLIVRTTATLDALDRLPRYRGHFFNWYDTETLTPLEPRYVSTVDSGNLCGHLLVLAAGLDECAANDVDPATDPATDSVRVWAGLEDACGLVDDNAAVKDAIAAKDFDAVIVAADACGGAADSFAYALGAQARAARDEDHSDGARGVRARELRVLAARARALAVVEWAFLYDEKRGLLSIGLNVGEHRKDESFYDLLASEARLGSFVAIAQGALPQAHWFSLGRALTTSAGRPALLSWSGSMFEYLMPLLVMPSDERTLLDETHRAVVERQIEYGDSKGLAWGISESGYAKTDAQQNYQYRAFGVPGLGFKRGLADDVVVAPYASAMALMVDARAAVKNLRRLAKEGVLGACGFYEAVDHTAARMPPQKQSVTVRSYMAHHQGMAFLSFCFVLKDRPMQRRFLADPALRATELLLQERVPLTPPIQLHPAEASSLRVATNDGAPGVRAYNTPSTPRPEVHLLSNGRYHVAVSNAGGGYSRFGDLAVTRWREDPTADALGNFCYVKDVDGGAAWSTAHQPTLRRADRYEAVFSPGRAGFRRTDGDIETQTEICVSPEDDVELRRVRITNRSRAPRTLEITSYAEVVLATPAADAAHPAFSNLFVQTELLRAEQAILCTRRPRSAHEKPPTLLHLMALYGAEQGPTSFETSREAFVGRCGTLHAPQAMTRAALSDSEGSVLDPVVAIRNRVTIEPHQTVTLHMVTGVAESRERALTLVEKYRDRHSADRALELSWTQSQVVLRRLDTSDADAQLYERLASYVLYSNPTLRAADDIVQKNRRGQSALWGYGISGDLPIVLVRIGDIAELQLVRHLLKAQAYWRLKGLIADLVIWNEDPSGYRQELNDRILALVAATGDINLVDKPGGVFVRRGEQISEEDKLLLQAVARVVVSDTAGTLAEQLDKRSVVANDVDLFAGADRRVAVAESSSQSPAPTLTTRTDLAAWNGLGGFTPDGREYVINTSAQQRTPAPWVNVIANPWFGTVVSESGGAYTWCENAHGHRLTPWGNDPVTDASGEAVYLRDEEDGRAWSPTPLPAPGPGRYVTRHGFGYSVFEHENAGVRSALTTFVATDAPLKFILINLKNTSDRPRRLSLTGVFDLVLGATRAPNLPHIVTNVDVKSGAAFAHNAYNNEFADRTAFLDVSEARRTVSGDRTEVLGRNGTRAAPRFLKKKQLSGRVGARLDACLAMQVVVELAPGEEREVAFTFGSGRNRDDARHLVGRFRGTGAAHVALGGVWDYWNRTLGAVNVQTPDATLNFLANGWLLYQVLAARMWARSGYYQSGGAFGFRDQLQDAMSLVHAEPGLLREQILRCAGRQFVDGDVQHWWHPPLGRGVRTRISDDYLWLPFAVARYVGCTGDTGVLDEAVAWLDGRPVRLDEDSYYDLPSRTAHSDSLYAHCVQALRHGLRFGVHGLPLMGTGDWNDGMNLVGDGGKGESVWLGFFLHDVLQRFLPLARARGDDVVAALCVDQSAALAAAIEEHAWDGSWYRRAWFDDGTPLGSAQNSECQIDALPQSWAVLTGVGDDARARQALAAVDARLVKRDLGVIQLFDPPFNGGVEPGYVRGYVPGVRENGGQYTHAAVWTVMAFAAAGDVDRAWELFNLINPLRHGDTVEKAARYKVEPYVVAADVYTNAQHAGRGGWTWYTGSAGWMYRLVVESLLGIHREVDRLRVTPLLPRDWPGFDVHYRFRDTVHHIRVQRVGPGSDVVRVVCDGVEQAGHTLPMHGDRREHVVVVEVG